MSSIEFTPTSLHRAEQATLMALSAKGQHNVFQRREVGSFRFLSAVDETTIPEPAVPVRRHQLNRPSFSHYRGRTSDECVSHEHDDRRVEYSPTLVTIAVPSEMSSSSDAKLAPVAAFDTAAISVLLTRE